MFTNISTYCPKIIIPAPIAHLHIGSFANSPHSSSPITHNSHHSFSAKERDAETGLSYFGSRYYSADLSVWLSVDPMSGKYPSLSPYVYCADNPVKLVDPNGELYTDFINSGTGDCMHIDDEKDQVVIINNSDYNTIANMNQTQYSSMSSSQQSSYDQILARGNKVDMNTTLGKMIRAVYAEI